MAQALSFTAGRVTSFGFLKGARLIITLTADTYATASGGISIDFTTLFTALGIVFTDEIEIIGGRTALGHRADFTKTATTNIFTMRLWNGTTEIADGATTQVVTCLLVSFAGSTNN